MLLVRVGRHHIHQVRRLDLYPFAIGLDAQTLLGIFTVLHHRFPAFFFLSLLNGFLFPGQQVFKTAGRLQFQQLSVHRLDTVRILGDLRFQCLDAGYIPLPFGKGEFLQFRPVLCDTLFVGFRPADGVLVLCQHLPLPVGLSCALQRRSKDLTVRSSALLEQGTFTQFAGGPFRISIMLQNTFRQDIRKVPVDIVEQTGYTDSRTG